ncbi:MAG: phosphatidylinositol-specific phospholipase C/glycerophosphodiester phosphodiesterase family protein [Sphingobacteriales bacterium]
MIFSVKLLKTFVFFLLLFSFSQVYSQSVPLPNAFAHNDYRHRRPLFDAVENGYTNIEADIFLEGNHIIVAHVNPFFRRRRTLETLYLKPLSEMVEKNNGQVYKGYNQPVILMIDVKTGAKNTYNALKPLLEKYRPMLSSYDHGKVSPGAVTVVLSGHKPYNLIKGEETRLAFIDEDLRKTVKDTTTANVYTMSSCKYSKLLAWTGNGAIPENERIRLCSYVNMAHKYRKKVRLWASPENAVVWKELLTCGVDLINTDKLVSLKNFLTSYDTSYANSPKPQQRPAGMGVLNL